MQQGFIFFLKGLVLSASALGTAEAARPVGRLAKRVGDSLLSPPAAVDFLSVSVWAALGGMLLGAAACYVLARRFLSSDRAQSAARRDTDCAILKQAPVAIFAADRSGIITFSSGQLLQSLGIKSGEHVGLSIFDVYKDVPNFLATIRRALAGETLVALEETIGVALEVHYTPLRNPGGELDGFVGVAMDVKHRKEAEDALHEGEARFRALFEEAPIAYHEIDTQGIVQRVNHTEGRLLGFELSQMLGQHIWDFVAAADREASKAAVQQKLKGQMPLVPFQREYARRDGARLNLEIHEALIRDRKGAIVGIRSAMLDITERKRVERELEQRARETILSSEFGSMLQTCLTMEEAYSVVSRTARKFFPGTAGAVFVVSPSRNLVEAGVTWGDSGGGEEVFAPYDCWALRSGRAHFVADTSSEMTCRHVSKVASASYLCVPMMAQGDTIGVLHIYAAPGALDEGGENAEALTAAKQPLALAMADKIGLALANLRLRETLRTQSIRDSLTGLYNRRYMEESLERELRRAARSHRPLGAIMIDLDHFKQCNDTFGHDAGDTILRELGHFLQLQIRGEDVACRYGGEEFMIILPDASLEGTQTRAEQLREGIKHLNIQHRGQSLGTVTMSVGVAEFPQHGTTGEDILRAADNALFKAKAQGRDRVVIWTTA